MPHDSDTYDDTYDENLSRLLRGAQVQPALSDDRRQAMLRDLQEQLDRAAQARRKTTMRRWIASAASLAAAAVVVIGLVLSDGGGRARPGKQPSGAAVRLTDGTRLIARGQSRYAVVGDRRVRLEAGQLLLLVAKADKPFVVETPQVRAEAKGTIFTVSTDEAGSRVAVGQGRVGVTNPQGAVEVRRGEQAFAAPGSAPRRSPAPRFSHQVNWAREHLGGEVPLAADAPRPAGELVAFDPWGRQVRLELRKFHVDVVIEDGIARTTVDQTFFNQVSWQLEGTFTFPLPPDASLSRLAMYVGCDLNEGGMVEREYGRYVYETIVYTRRDPALLEMMEGNVFKMRVFPIFGRQEKRVLLSYTQTLPELYRTLRYWFPMDHGNDKARQVSVRVRVKDAAGRYEAASSTHEVQTREDGADLLIEHEAGNVPPNQDFLLNLTPLAGRGEALTVRHCVQDGATYVFARWRPELTGQVEPRPRQWFFINDVSASRSSVDVRTQAYVIERFLAEADDQDAFALVNLDTLVRPWRTELTGVHDPQAVSATAFADVSERMGATDLAAALRAVGELIARSGADNPHIVYLGDGIATDAETRTDRLVAALPAGATFIGLGVGKKIDARFLQAAADATGGLFAPINPSEDVRWRVFDLVAALNTPRLVHVDVAFLDAAGKPMAAAAHPSSGCLSDGEALTVLAQTGNVLPARMIVLGESRGRPFRQDFDLSASRGEAAFIPRLWAAARINHLLREDADAHKAEIVALSKAFYVVTPFTSLIVLENEADYKKWNVEMGRKDHWQLYPAPKKIPIVHEPLEHGAWEVPAAAMKGTPGHPKTVEEIVESVQFRVHVPLYGHHPYQRRRTERFALQALLSGRGMAAAHGVVSPVLPILLDDQEDELRIGTGKTGAWEWGTEAALGLDFKPHVSTRISGPATLGSLGTELGGWGFGYYLGGEMLPMSLELPSSGFVPGGDKDGDVALRLADLYLTEESILAPGVPMSQGMASATAGTWGGDFHGRLAALSHFTRDGWAESPAILADLRAEPGFLAPALDADVDGRFRQSRSERWSEERQRIRAYNRRFGGWYEADWSGFGDGLQVAAGRETAESIGATIRVVADAIRINHVLAPPVAGSPEPGPPALAKALAEVPPSVLAGRWTRAAGAVPGTLATLAVDRLLPLRAKLAALPAGAKRDKALAALDELLKKLPDLSARTEGTGVFWSYRGWDCLPQPWDYQPPQCQVWSGSRALIDLTRYAPALESTWADVAELVLAAFGKDRAGKVDPAAAARIDAARANAPTQRIGYTDEQGKVLFELWAGRGDRLAWTRRNAMYLREEFVCDGNALYHAYPELGLAARRTEAALRVRALRRLVPHLLPPAKDLARGFDVRLEKAEGDLATIRLTPLAAQGEKPAAKLAVLITFDKRGFVHSQQWQVDGEVRLACTVSYADSRVEITWRAGEKELGKAAYACEITQPQEDPFAAPTKGRVVLDMPLRRPEHYQALLKEIEADADKAPERLGLRRHLAFAQLQEHSWQVPWGNVEPAYQTLLAGLQEAAKAKLAAASLGDLAILASAGHAASIRNQAAALGLPSGDPLWAYWCSYQSFPEMAKLAESQKGTFAGHLAAFVRTYQGGNDRPDRARQLMREYPDSALLPAAAIHCGGNEDVWLELAGNRRWRLMALLGAAQYKQKPTAKIGEAFEACFQELSDAGWEVPISSRMVAALRTDEARWQRVVKRALAAAMESKDPGRLLRFAELTWPHGEKELAETALAAAAELVEPKLTLTWKLTLTQSLTAMGRTKEAWELNRQILKALEEHALSPSPALLAFTARLAQRVGQSDLAVEYERQAIEAEQPHMPRRINVQLFRHRYQWLWEQLDQRVRQVAAAARSAPGDAQKQRLLDEALAAAKDVWETWKRVDTANDADLYLRLATLHRHAGNGQEAWRAVSSVIDENPREGSSYYHVGRWYVSGGDRDAAEGWYARAYEVEPTNGDWAWQRAELLKQMGRKDQARALYEEIAAKKWQRRFEHYNAQAREALKKL